MSEKLTFIHSGDLHLGSPFSGLRALSSAWARRLSRAIPEAYDRVIKACTDNQVDFLLLAGDIFDTDKPSYAHLRHFIRGLERLKKAGIPVYMIAGNHDPYANWSDILPLLPSNVRMLPSDAPEFVLHRASDGEPLCVIAARGFSNQATDGSVADGMTRADARRATGVDAAFAVGMLHSGLWMDPVKDPVSEAKLLAAEMDYWALGHIHKSYVTPKADPRIVFCGCIQGRDIKETGARGCYKVTLEKGMPNRLEFIPTAQVDWEHLHVDVSECSGIDDILAACVQAMFKANAAAQCEEMVVRVTIKGATPLYDVLASPGAVEDMRIELNEKYPTFYCDALVNATVPPLDKEALASAGLFPATLLRCAQEMRTSTQGGSKGSVDGAGSLSAGVSPDATGAAEAAGLNGVPVDVIDNNPYAPPDRPAPSPEFAAMLKKPDKGDVRLVYLQEEFARRGLGLPRVVERSLDDLTEAACDLVLALLDGRNA